MGLARAGCLVAADGGATRVLRAGRMPDAVIGDFDSIDAFARAAIAADRQHRIAEQESTDFDKCLRSVAAPLILAVGFTGWRLDHTLAAFNTLVRHPEQRCIVIGSHDLCFLAPARIRLRLPPGVRCSLFPMGEVAGESDGLRWPLEGKTFSPDGRIGTSNEVISAEVTLGFSARKMVVILPLDHLDAAIRGLAPELARPGVRSV